MRDITTLLESVPSRQQSRCVAHRVEVLIIDILTDNPSRLTSRDTPLATTPQRELINICRKLHDRKTDKSRDEGGRKHSGGAYKSGGGVFTVCTYELNEPSESRRYIVEEKPKVARHSGILPLEDSSLPPVVTSRDSRQFSSRTCTRRSFYYRRKCPLICIDVFRRFSADTFRATKRRDNTTKRKSNIRRVLKARRTIASVLQFSILQFSRFVFLILRGLNNRIRRSCQILLGWTRLKKPIYKNTR